MNAVYCSLSTDTMFTTLVLAVIVFLIIYRFLSQNFKYWKKLGVPNPPVNLFFGNLANSVILKQSLGQIYTDIYNAYKDYPYVGFYKIRTPGILVRDPNIVKDILIKDFGSFQKNDINVDEKCDPLAAKNPFMLSGQKWKATRSHLSSCFTSGKMKSIMPLINDVSSKMVTYLEEKCSSKENYLETKELATKFTTDNVASCAFGLDARSFLDAKAEFREVGRKILEPSFLSGLKYLCIFVFPAITKLIKIRFVPKECDAYLRNVVTGTLEYRKANGIVRNDFLDAMDLLKTKSGEFTFTDEDVTAHAMSFFTDGYETSSVTMSFVLYDLASNPSTQEQLKKEIDEVLEKSNGEVTYEAVQEMTYLDSVFCESMRLHPPGMVLAKVCTSPYNLPPLKPNGESLTIEAGTPIILPLYALQHDEKYFPEPERFDPGRFSKANRETIAKGTYFPFGDGPRMCLGQRFAILQVKVAVVWLIKNFEVRVNKKTITPLEMDPRYFMLVTKGGLWLDYYKRSK